MPLIAKDTIKDAVFTMLPVTDVEASRQLGRASVAAMLAIAAAASPVGAVLESNFYRSMATDSLRQLPGVLIEVFCRCDRMVSHDRYRARAGTRHAGHFDTVRAAEELWNDEVAEPVAGGWPVLEVDTNQAVGLPALVALIKQTVGNSVP